MSSISSTTSVTSQLTASPAHPLTKPKDRRSRCKIAIENAVLTDSEVETLLGCRHLTLVNCSLKSKHLQVLTQSHKNYLEFSNCSLRRKDPGLVPIPDTQLVERNGVMVELETFDDEIPDSLLQELSADTPKSETQEVPILDQDVQAAEKQKMLDPELVKLVEAHKKQQIKERENKLAKYIEFGEALCAFAQNYIALLVEHTTSFYSVEPSLNPLEAGKIQLQQCLYEVETVIRSYKDKSNSSDYLLNMGGVAIQNLVNLLYDINNAHASRITSYSAVEGYLIQDPKFNLFGLLRKYECPEIEEINFPRNSAS